MNKKLLLLVSFSISAIAQQINNTPSTINNSIENYFIRNKGQGILFPFIVREIKYEC
jgi:hypothetical protein